MIVVSALTVLDFGFHHPVSDTLGPGRGIAGDIPVLYIAYVLVGLSVTTALALWQGITSLERPRRAKAAFTCLLVGAGTIVGLWPSVRTRGFLAATVLVTVSQLTITSILRHFGWLGLPRRRLDVGRGIGLLLLIIGTWLVLD